MENRFQHTQIGYATLIVLGAIMAVIGCLSVVEGLNLVALAVLIVLAVCMASFATLKTVINRNVLTIRFGPGIVQRQFPLQQVESCQVVKNPWYYGLGIHVTPDGWLYNVSGFYAVEIRMANGKKYRIGTDAPNELERAIRQSAQSARR